MFPKQTTTLREKRTRNHPRVYIADEEGRGKDGWEKGGEEGGRGLCGMAADTTGCVRRLARPRVASSCLACNAMNVSAVENENDLTARVALHVLVFVAVYSRAVLMLKIARQPQCGGG